MYAFLQFSSEFNLLSSAANAEEAYRSWIRQQDIGTKIKNKEKGLFPETCCLNRFDRPRCKDPTITLGSPWAAETDKRSMLTCTSAFGYSLDFYTSNAQFFGNLLSSVLVLFFNKRKLARRLAFYLEAEYSMLNTLRQACPRRLCFVSAGAYHHLCSYLVLHSQLIWLDLKYTHNKDDAQDIFFILDIQSTH